MLYHRWNINSVDVELKHWLYKNGDECIHNTGGWIKCAVSASNDGGAGNTPSLSSSVDILADKIELRCSGSATVTLYYPDKIRYYSRNGFTVQANIGTQKQLAKDISLYRKLKTNTSNGLSGTFRTGSVNNASTAVNTATILLSGSAGDLDINIASGYPFLVIGAYYKVASVYRQAYTSPGTASVNYDSDITEIWLE